jgi:acetyl-CoA carboxylase beta subunit
MPFLCYPVLDCNNAIINNRKENQSMAIKCPECNRQKYIIRSIEAGKRICTKCNLKFKMNPNHWIWKNRNQSNERN